MVVLCPGIWGSKFYQPRWGELHTGLTSLSFLGYRARRNMNLRTLKKRGRKEQKTQDNDRPYLFLIIRKVLRTNSRIFTREILSFWKLVINVAHTAGMVTISKFAQQEEYFLGNKVKILVLNWASMGQINEVTTPSWTSICEIWERGCINSTSIHGTGQRRKN